MKTLFLVRHAKSDWPANVSDFDRPLSERGHRDAPKMAEFLKSKNVEIEFVWPVAITKSSGLDRERICLAAIAQS